MAINIQNKEQVVFEDFEVPDKIRIKKSVKILKKYIPDLSNLNILECGIAKGGFVDEVKKEGPNCYGVDINPRSIEGAEVKKADLNSGIPDFGVKFNIIFAGELIEHLFDDKKFLKECFDNLKEGGYLILTTPNINFTLNRLAVFFGQLPKYFVEAPFHYHLYNKKKITLMLEKIGFEVKKIVSSHLLFSTRRNKLGKVFEILGDLMPNLGAHLIILSQKSENKSNK